MQLISRYVDRDRQRFARLMDLFFSEEYRIQQRASWAVMHCVDRHPRLINPYLEKMVGLLDKPVHDSVKRNTTRILHKITIPEELYGSVADHCFRLLSEPATSTAIKVFSMYILLKIVKKEPGLARELRLVIEENLPHASYGVQHAAEKTLRQLDV